MHDNLPLPFVAPMPVNEFLPYFLPGDDAPDITLGPADSERAFAESVNESGLCPNLTFTADDIPSQPGTGGIDMPHMRSNVYAFSRAVPAKYRKFWRKLELVVLRRKPSDDPFTDPDPNSSTDRKSLDFKSASPGAATTRAHLFALADAQFKHQPRVFSFAILLLDSHARLVRWDRSGALVSSLFLWTAPRSPLVVFLSLFDRLSAEDRGRDWTISTPSHAQASVARDALARFAAEVEVAKDEPLQRFSICDEHVLVAPCRGAYGRALGAGRETAGRLAVDVATGSLVLLKDIWRVVDAEHGKEKFAEGVVHKALESVGMPGATPMICGGDVAGQRTVTQAFVGAEWACGMGLGGERVVARQRHWVVLANTHRSLNRFKSTRELVETLNGAVKAHGELHKEGQLHKDVAPHNILIRDA